MKSISFRNAGAFALCALVTVFGACHSAFAQTPQYPQDSPKGQDQSKDKSKGPQVSEAEQKAAMKIQAAPDVPAKLTASSEFLKKYSKSILRPQIANHVAAEISKSQDPAQQITLSESFLTTFNTPADADIINPLLLNAYIKANRLDDAFRIAGLQLEKNPNDVAVLTQMTLIGADQAKRNNPKYVAQTQQYGARAIELVEADKKPEAMTAENWNEYKTFWLPNLYQSQGMILYLTGKKDEAKVKLEKAASLNSPDPITYMLLGTMVDEEYRQLAEQVKGMMPGATQNDVLKRAHEKMDQVIDMYAHALGLASGNPQYQQFYDKLLQEVSAYYKYRNKGSTDGLQQLIDKYKRPSTSQ